MQFVRLDGVIASAVAIVLIACTREHPARNPEEPRGASVANVASVSAAPAPSAAPSASAAPAPTPSAAPTRLEAAMQSCESGLPGQSCAPGPGQVDWQCKLGCSETCKECVGSCGTKASPDECAQRCVAVRDRCSTGECARNLQAYMKELVTKKLGCKGKGTVVEICGRVAECFGTCGESPSTGDPESPCEKRCLAAHAKGCENQFTFSARYGACGGYQVDR